MKKILTPEQRIAERRLNSFKVLNSLANQNVPNGKSTMTFAMIGAKLGITGQTVYNYVQGRGSDGFVIEELIKEFAALKP